MCRPPVRWRAAHRSLLFGGRQEPKTLMSALVRRAERQAGKETSGCLPPQALHRWRVRLRPTCGLTLRSKGRAPAWHLAHEAIQVIICLAGQAPHRRAPLSSNVRPHATHTVVNAVSMPKAPNAKTFKHSPPLGCCRREGNKPRNRRATRANALSPLTVRAFEFARARAGRPSAGGRHTTCCS